MFSALEALLTLGKCRELPVVGFVGGFLIMGVIVRYMPSSLRYLADPND